MENNITENLETLINILLQLLQTIYNKTKKYTYVLSEINTYNYFPHHVGIKMYTNVWKPLTLKTFMK